MKLLPYIKGIRRGKEAHRVELEAMKDSFLSEALEGYDSIDDNHFERISHLQKQINRRALNKKPIRKKKQIIIPWKNLSIAASVLICLSLGGYFLATNYKSLIYYASSILPDSKEEPVKENVVAAEIDTIVSKQDTMIIYLPVSNLPNPEMIAQVIEDRIERLEIAKLEAPQIGLTVDETEPSPSIPTLVAVAASPSTENIKSSVRGRVTDKSGEPLIGVTVRQKGHSGGTITDVNGNFSLNIPDSQQPIILDYIGFEHIELPPDTGKSMMIAMNENRQTLDEVVVVGYGTTKKTTTTGSVSTINAPELNENVKPEPEMGMSAYKNYLKTNVVRPTDEAGKNIKGKVKLQFSVNREGNPYNIRVVKSLGESADAEAIRLIQSGGKWKYGSKTVDIEVGF